MRPKTPDSLALVAGTTFRKYSSFTQVTREEIQFIRQLALAGEPHRARINLHCDDDALVHEMIIAMGPLSLSPPHFHRDKSESFHVLSGVLRVGILDHLGILLEILELSADMSPCYRMNDDLNHFPVAASDVVVFHETTNGPFRKGESLRLDDWARTMTTTDLAALRARVLGNPTGKQ
jgi:cupin fold WbuC family metalloprotein